MSMVVCGALGQNFLTGHVSEGIMISEVNAKQSHKYVKLQEALRIGARRWQ
jgi:hypothetical protein